MDQEHPDRSRHTLVGGMAGGLVASMVVPAMADSGGGTGASAPAPEESSYATGQVYAAVGGRGGHDFRQ